jgi:hypothetical protein
MPMKTLVIRKGDTLTIRAVATPSDDGGRDKCETLAFFQDCSQKWPKEFDKLSGLLSDTVEFGPPEDEKKFKVLAGSDGIYEFKTHFGLRLLCFWDDDGLIICSHGYVKDKQKIPKPELNRAERVKKEYFESKKAGDLNHAEPKK